MKYKSLTIILGVTFIPFVLSAQSATIPAGMEATGSGGTSSVSIGQTFYQVQSSNGTSITEGVQQTYSIISANNNLTRNIEVNVSAYPNPAIDNLNLEIENVTSELSYILYDVSGKLITQSKITSEHEVIQLTQFPSTSFVLVIQENQETIKTFQIIKN